MLSDEAGGGEGQGWPLLQLYPHASLRSAMPGVQLLGRRYAVCSQAADYRLYNTHCTYKYMCVHIHIHMHMCMCMY